MSPTTYMTSLCSAVAIAAASSAIAGPDSMTFAEARHFLARTGFDPAPHEATALIGRSYESAVEAALDGISARPVLPMPEWTTDWLYPSEQVWALGNSATDVFFMMRWQEIEELSAWWLAEMAATPSPLTERLVLFWSDHFANSFEDHENSQWMARQSVFLRKHAAGDFRELLHGRLFDPAIL